MSGLVAVLGEEAPHFGPVGARLHVVGLDAAVVQKPWKRKGCAHALSDSPVCLPDAHADPAAGSVPGCVDDDVVSSSP